MKLVSIAVLAFIVYLIAGILAYASVQQGINSIWWYLGIAIFAILFGAGAATITTTYKIYLREKRNKEIRAMMWHEGKGRD